MAQAIFPFKGFRYAGTLANIDTPPQPGRYLTAAAASWHEGDTVSLNAAGKLILGVTNSSRFLGIANESVDSAKADYELEVIQNQGMVLEVYDPNGRILGANLDIAGATGAQGVTTSTNADLIVVRSTNSAENSYVTFFPSETVLGF